MGRCSKCTNYECQTWEDLYSKVNKGWKRNRKKEDQTLGMGLSFVKKEQRSFHVLSFGQKQKTKLPSERQNCPIAYWKSTPKQEEISKLMRVEQESWGEAKSIRLKCPCNFLYFLLLLVRKQKSWEGAIAPPCLYVAPSLLAGVICII